MGRRRKKKCRFCGKWFQPEPRSGSRQIRCSFPACAKKRKKHTQSKWHHEKNPTYFHSRYENTKQWLKEHPGYLKAYRRSRPEYRRKNRERQKIRDTRRAQRNLDIQDSLKLQELSYQGDTYKLSNLDIQDPLLSYPELFLGLMSCLRNLDIQDPIGISLHSIYNRGRFLFRRYVKL